MARCPFGGAWDGLEEVGGRAQRVDEVGTVVVEVRRHAVRVVSGIRRTVEEGLLAVAGRGRGGSFLLSWVELERAEDGVREFKGRGEIALHASVERIAED